MRADVICACPLIVVGAGKVGVPDGDGVPAAPASGIGEETTDAGVGIGEECNGTLALPSPRSRRAVSMKRCLCPDYRGTG